MTEYTPKYISPTANNKKRSYKKTDQKYFRFQQIFYWKENAGEITNQMY